MRNKSNLLIIIWFLLPFIAVLLEIRQGNSHINNYLIFKNVFWNTLKERNLYNFYPNLYEDKNHYGPFFSLIIAPFSLMPNIVGATLWVMINVWVLFYAIQKLPITNSNKNVILIIGLIETLTAVQNLQFNPMLTGWILLTYIFVIEDKLILASMFIIAGLFVKLYGIVGLPFLLFNKNYKRAILYLFIWAIIFYMLPMIISSPRFIYNSYFDWFSCIVEKNTENINSYQNQGMTDISAMGLVKRVTGIYSLSNLYFLLPAGLFSLLPLCRKSFLNNLNFQLSFVSQILIGLVIFSTSAESPTYVIAVIGFAIWFSLDSTKKNKWVQFLLILIFILTVLSPTDIFPRSIRDQYVIKYSLKALPCLLVWITIIYQLLFTSSYKNKLNEI